MKDNLQDLIKYVHGLGVIELIKVVGTDKQTVVSALADDKTVVVEGTFKNPLADFIGTFGMPQLPKLKNILSLDDIYDEKASIVVERHKDGTPIKITFDSAVTRFHDNYRFMAKSIVEEKVKDVKFKGATWNVEFSPTIDRITMLKKKAMIHNEETNFIAKTDKNDLMIYFGDQSSHNGGLAFHTDVDGSLSKAWAWPVKVFLAIMDMPGEKTVRISDQGAAEITVDSGLATYRYLLPAQAK
jgi:hypothetical protein